MHPIHSYLYHQHNHDHNPNDPMTQTDPFGIILHSSTSTDVYPHIVAQTIIHN